MKKDDGQGERQCGDKSGREGVERRGHKTADTRDTFSSFLLALTFPLLSGAAAGCFPR